jgi:hypothetical protein
MRPWISLLLLGAGLTAAIAAPASAANTMTPRFPVVVVHNGRVHAPFHRHLRSRPGFSPFAFGAPLVVPDQYFGSGAASGTPPVIMLGEAPAVAAPMPPVPVVEQRPSVETTAEGVVIVRGPGSHHLGY